MVKRLLDKGNRFVSIWDVVMEFCFFRHLHVIKNSPFLHNILLNGSILATNKCCENVKDLLVCGDRYDIKHDLTCIVHHQ